MNRLILFLTVLDIFDDEIMNSTFRNKKMADQKLYSNINLCEIWYLGVPDITNYKLVHDLEIQNNGSNMVDWNDKNKYINLDEIQYTEVFAVADAKTRDAKIV